jgi:hypothetical protein
MIDGRNIKRLIDEAALDHVIRYRLYFCPDKAISGRGFSDEETNAILFGELGRVLLDDETRAKAQKIFNEPPFNEDMPPETAAVNTFTMKPATDPCI